MQVALASKIAWDLSSLALGHFRDQGLIAMG